MHILLIHQAFAALSEPGGTRHHELALHLAARGHRVTIIASPVSYLTGKASKQHIPWVEKEDGGSGVTILRVYTYPALHKSFVHRLLSFLSFMFSSFWVGLQVKKVDLIWGTSPPIFQGITAQALAWLKRVPWLFEVRDLWPAFAIAVGVLRQPVLIQASVWLEKFLYRHSDLVMVNSPGFINHVTQSGAREVVLVPNGAETSMFDPQADGIPFRQQNQLGKNFIAMYTGAHGLSNNLETVLEASNLLKDRPDIRIVLLGDGKDKPSLIAQAKQMSLANVIFLPPIPKINIPSALAAADACIAILKPIPLYATVYPNKVFDYLAAGRPIIMAMEGVIQQLVMNAQAGLCIPPGDPPAMAQAIQWLADHPEERQTMGLNGRKYVEENFDRTKLAEQLVGILENLVKR
jgi:glycosyltransferase involved in cell wall biosynthesis